MEVKNYSKFSRKNPIKEFDLNQTMYSLVKNESKDDLNLSATGFMGNSMTYGELFASSEKLAQAFVNDGVKNGDSVAILTVSMPIAQQCILALSKIGATMSWIDLRTKGNDLIKYINSSNCKFAVVVENVFPLVQSIINETDLQKVIVVSPKDYLSPITKILANIKDIKEGKKNEMPEDSRFIKFKDFLESGKGIEVETAKFEKDKPSIIVQSSGSTGKPKQIMHTEYNFNSSLEKMAYSDFPFYKGETMHISIPPFVIYGLGNSIYGSMAFTMKAEMSPYVDANTVYNDLGKFDMSLAAPLHYRYIYGKLQELKRNIDTLSHDSSASAKKELKAKMKEIKRVLNGLRRARVFISGGDKIGAEELITMQQEFDTIIVNGYGNNECLGAAIVSPMYANKPGSIGVPLHNVGVKIVDPDTLEELPPFSAGEVLISSDNLFKEYLGNPEATKEVKITYSDGKEYIRSGDLGYIDQEEYVFIKGRIRRLIKKEAFKISPDTIEEVIKSLSFVKDCVVVGVNDEIAASVPMAFIVIDDNIDFNEIKSLIEEKCYQELPDYEVPSYFEKIKEIPYTKNNKQDFRLLEDIGNKIVLENKGKALVREK